MAISKEDYRRLEAERNALRDEVKRLRSVVPKVVEVPVTVLKDRIVEVPVEVIKDRIVEVPVEVIKVEYRDNETVLVKNLKAKLVAIMTELAALKEGAK